MSRRRKPVERPVVLYKGGPLSGMIVRALNDELIQVGTEIDQLMHQDDPTLKPSAPANVEIIQGPIAPYTLTYTYRVVSGGLQEFVAEFLSVEYEADV